MLWPLGDWASPWVQWHPQHGSAMGGRVCPMLLYRPWSYGPGCLSKYLRAVTPPDWQRNGWQNISKNCVEALVLWPLGAWASPWVQWHHLNSSAVGGRVSPMILYRPWCSGPCVSEQVLEGSGTSSMAVQWVAEYIQELCIGPDAMASGCLGKPMGAVAPPE